jgi:hypothetical protein
MHANHGHPDWVREIMSLDHVVIYILLVDI